jgi:ubiquinone/menaquinone biosynthesis C-methylase UbiE
MKGGNIPLPDKSVDVIWVCLVLGCIKGRLLKKSVSEMARVLKDGGLVFLVENTQEQEDTEYWAYRQFDEYKRLLAFVKLTHLHDYFDVGERISIMAGRKLQ